MRAEPRTCADAVRRRGIPRVPTPPTHVFAPTPCHRAAARDASLALRLALQRFLGAEVPFLQFFPAIMLAAWVGGLGPGLVAVAASAALAVYFFIPPLHDLTISDPADAVSLVLFVATGTGICWLNHRLKGFEEEGRAAANRDRARTQELQNILDTAVDGIIVIDAAAASSRSTGARRAALRLPAGDVLTFHRHAVCKTDRHGAFCRWRPGS